MTDTLSPLRRRLLQGAGLLAIGAWVWGVPRLARLGREPLAFSDIPGAAPFRRLDREGAVSAGAAIFAGLETTAPPLQGPICDALYGTSPQPAIAYFSDINCPNCPRMEAATRAAIGSQQIPLIRHELPLLGPGSTAAARLILAAKRQAPATDVAGLLAAIPGPVTPARLTKIAADIGIDAAQWQADTTHPAVTKALADTAALARRLGIYGTPGTVIGRTLILGALPQDQIAEIIEIEQQADPICN